MVFINSDIKDIRARSWFLVLNNPEKYGYTGDPEEIVVKILDDWCKDYPTRSGACTYCLSADGLKHLHIVLEDTKLMRFSAVKKVFPTAHIEVTKGTKEQAEDYIHKRGKFEEKGEKVLAFSQRGEIKGAQGQRKDFEIIEDLLDSGCKPNEIMQQNFSYRRYEKMIKQAYFDKRKASTPVKRDVSVYWHCGDSGSGKTYSIVGLMEEYGDDDVYLLNDFDKGGFDLYSGEKVLCMDEFRGQMRFSLFLQYLDGYRFQVPCRYTNALALWDEVHIFSILPPESVYVNMVKDNHDIDTFEQLRRRVDFVVYHYKDKKNGDFLRLEIPMDEYRSYDELKSRIECNSLNSAKFSEVPDGFELPRSWL